MSKVNFVKVERNSFNDEKTGRKVDYCKFYCLVPTPETDNSFGFDVESFTTKYGNYDTIKGYAKKGTPVDVELEYVKQKDGLYKAKIVKIDGLDLV